jgi:hypothetical protein
MNKEAYNLGMQLALRDHGYETWFDFNQNILEKRADKLSIKIPDLSDLDKKLFNDASLKDFAEFLQDQKPAEPIKKVQVLEAIDKGKKMIKDTNIMASKSIPKKILESIKGMYSEEPHVDIKHHTLAQGRLEDRPKKLVLDYDPLKGEHRINPDTVYHTTHEYVQPKGNGAYTVHHIEYSNIPGAKSFDITVPKDIFKGDRADKVLSHWRGQILPSWGMGGAALGGLTGAGIGALTAKKPEDRTERALYGGGIGTVGGGLLGLGLGALRGSAQGRAQLTAEFLNSAMAKELGKVAHEY